MINEEWFLVPQMPVQYCSQGVAPELPASESPMGACLKRGVVTNESLLNLETGTRHITLLRNTHR